MRVEIKSFKIFFIHTVRTILASSMFVSLPYLEFLPYGTFGTVYIACVYTAVHFS